MNLIRVLEKILIVNININFLKSLKIKDERL
jgi:hypothetical protein